MARLLGYIAASLDGFVADRDGGVSWLEPFQTVDTGMEAFLSGVGTVVMGRATWDQVWSFGIGWPYPGKRAVVLTHRPLDPDPAKTPSEGVETHSGDIGPLIQKLRARRGGDAWIVGGAQVQRDFIAAGALDRLELWVIPVLLGTGVPLFPPGGSLPSPSLEKVDQVGPLARLVYSWPMA